MSCPAHPVACLLLSMGTSIVSLRRYVSCLPWHHKLQLVYTALPHATCGLVSHLRLHIRNWYFCLLAYKGIRPRGMRIIA